MAYGYIISHFTMVFDEIIYIYNYIYMGVEPKIGGKPPKWMVKIMEIPVKMDDLGVKKTSFGNTHILM